MSARRPFDASFSRRAGDGGHGQGSLMGEPPLYSVPRSGPGGGGGRAPYHPEEADDLYSAGDGRQHQQQRFPAKTERYDEDEYDGSYDHVPRTPSMPMRPVKVQGGGDHNGGGGWRQRSPSPRYNQGGSGGGGGGGGAPSWTMREREREFDYSELQSQSRGGYQQQQHQQMGGVGSGGGGGFEASFSTQRNLFSTPGGMSGQQQQQQPLVMVLPSTPASGMMGNLALSGLNANPFGVLGQQPVIVGNPFQQMVQQQGGFSSGVAQQQQQSSIYGPQTQQAFNRFDSSRNLISVDDSRSRLDRGRGRNANDRRSNSRKSGGGGGGGGSGSVPARSQSDSRKRNLVLRDPRPEDINKRARMSEGNRNNKSPRGGGGGGKGGDATKVKRISIGTDGGGGGGKKGNNRPKPKPKLSDNASKDKEKSQSQSKDVKVEGQKKDEKKSNKEKDKKEDKDRKTKYDELPSALLVCKVCQKSMNDGQSFESHLSGRAHMSLLKILEERFAKRAELLMSESKCQEDEISIEFERQRRAGNKSSGRVDKNSNNYCKMCDCNYTVNWGTHKVSLGHRVLREFLHPTCHFCKTHYMHRKDWVIHLLSPDHMKKLNEIKKEGSMDLLEQESPFQDELFAINLQLTREERPTNVISVRSLDGKESLTEEMKEILKNDRGEIELPEGEIPIPEKQEEGVAVGMEAIIAVSGSRCRVCRVYISDDKEIETHCKSKEHFKMYVSFLKRVMRHREHKEQERKKAEEEKAKKEEEERKKQEKEAEAEKNKAEAPVAPEGETEESKLKLPNGEEVEGVNVNDNEEKGEKVDENETDTMDETQGQGDGVEGEQDQDQDGDEVEILDEVGEDGDEVEILDEVGKDGDGEGDELENGDGEEEEQLQETETDDVVMIDETDNSAAEIEKAQIEVEDSVKDEEIQILNVKSLEVAEATVPVTAADVEEIAVAVPEEMETEAPTTATPAIPAVAATPAATARRGATAVRGTPGFRGRGTGPASQVGHLKNVSAKVNTNLRGGAAGPPRGLRTGRAARARGGRGRGAR